MTTRQIIGWKPDGSKTTGSTATQARQRGAVGPLFRQSEEWNPATQTWNKILEAVGEHATA